MSKYSDDTGDVSTAKSGGGDSGGVGGGGDVGDGGGGGGDGGGDPLTAGLDAFFVSCGISAPVDWGMVVQ